MANNLIQIKRTSVSGRAANTLTLPNPGELALNMTDGILYSTNGSVVFEVGANNTNAQVTGTLTVNTISANGTTGSAGQVLTTNGSNVYWSAVSGGGGTVTQVNTGVGLTGGPIDTTGTISVNPNTGIIANSSGVFVNSAYIATLDANNASYLNGNTAATLRTYSETTAATAYTNATSYADTASATAYSNAVSTASADATSKAATAYSNATSYADTKAATAYSNAVSTASTDATSKASTAYSNATSYADTASATAYSNAVSTASTDATSKASTAYSNAVSTASADATSKAATAYSNSVSYFDSNVNTAIDARVTKSFVDALNVNANTLNGQLGSYYLDWTNTTNKPDPNITITLTGDVTGSGNTTLTDLANGTISITTTSSGGGAGLFKGENGTTGSSAGDIFRVNEQTLNTNVTISSTENASATGPLAVANGVTLTVSSGGSLVIL